MTDMHVALPANGMSAEICGSCTLAWRGYFRLHRHPTHNTLTVVDPGCLVSATHMCVSSQHKAGAQKLLHKTLVERPSTCGRVFQNPVNGVLHF